MSRWEDLTAHAQFTTLCGWGWNSCYFYTRHTDFSLLRRSSDIFTANLPALERQRRAQTTTAYTHSHTRIYVHYLYVRTYTQARKPSKMAAAVSRRDGALLASLLALFLGASCLPTDVDLIGFSRAILAMTNDTLGAGLMQVEIASCILIYIGRVCCVST